MKKSFFAFIIFSLVFSSGLMAQFNSVKLINAGVSFGLYEKYRDDLLSETFDKSISLPFHFQYEKGISEIPDLEEFSQHITVGVYAGIQPKQKYFKKYYADNLAREAFKNYFYLWGGLVGTVHAVGLANKYLDITIPADTWDVYLSVKGGLVYEHSKRNYEMNPNEVLTLSNEFEIKNDKTRIYLAPVLGVRYYFVEKVSLFGEFGYANLSVISVGASVKL